MSDFDAPVPLVSPLRYPGGKAFLCGYVERFLAANDLRPRTFVEPFAGGASVSLHLLGKDLVATIALYDKDPLVASFWWAVFHDGVWLKRKVRQATVTLDQWQALHQQSPNGHRTNAWKCLFLNRTSFSGIMSSRAGPLGGKRQQSENKIDCRFYRKTIAGRLQSLEAVRTRVKAVGAADWAETVARYSGKAHTDQPNACMLYLDPPFFHKAERLYNHCFTFAEHEALIKRLARLRTPWLLSYDHCSEAIALFRKYGLRYRKIPVRYTSSTGKTRDSKMELMASNLRLPKGAAL